MKRRIHAAAALSCLVLLLGLNLVDLAHHADHGGLDECAFCVCHAVGAPIPDAQLAPASGETQLAARCGDAFESAHTTPDSPRGRAPPRFDS